MRISTTTLESYRLFMQAEQEWMSEDELLATIRGEFTGNHNVWLGQAFGAVLEHPARHRVSGGYRVAGLRGCAETFDFGEDVMGPALALVHPRAVFEAKGIGWMAGHEIVAKADQMVGADLIETKTTLSTFDFDKYAASCQWKCMAAIFDVPRVTYHVFCLSESASNGVIGLKSVETFQLFPYAEMILDLEQLVREFADYVEARGLRPLLDARQVAAVGAL